LLVYTEAEQWTIKMRHEFVGEDKADKDGEADNQKIVDGTGRRRPTPQPEGVLQVSRDLLIIGGLSPGMRRVGVSGRDR